MELHTLKSLLPEGSGFRKLNKEGNDIIEIILLKFFLICLFEFRDGN